MIAYNITGLDHAVVNDQAENAFKKENITAEELAGIRKAFPEILYSPNFFIRIGLFLLTTVISACIFGLMMLIILEALEETTIGIMMLFFGACAYGLLEMWWVKEKNHFRSGIDDALVWISAAAVLSGIIILNDAVPAPWLTSAIVCVIAAWMTIRFADMLMALTAFASGIAFIFFTGFELWKGAADLMPFIIMAASLTAYLQFAKLSKSYRLRHYENCLTVLSTASLVMFYMAGNYFVVREVGASMLGKTGPVPAGWLFWGFTFLIPAVYIYFGLRRKNRVLLRTGLVLIGMIVFTVRYYHALLPIETAMALAGAALIVVAWAAIHYLKQPRHGFTFKADETDEEMTGLKAVEAVVIAQTFQKTPQPDDPFRFGGGTGGGGGASGEY